MGLRTQFPMTKEDGKWFVWIEFFGIPTSESDSTTVLPLGVSVRWDATDRDPKKWTTTGWFCMGEFYESTEDFRGAISSGQFQKPPPNTDGEWLTLKRHGEPLPLDELPPPTVVSPGKARYTMDPEHNYVSWMDFSFYMAVSKSTGLSLFNIQYKSKRIIYELGVQEALAQYAGSAPFQSYTNFFDSLGGMGAAMVSLVHGYDCPYHATYLNATMVVGGTLVTTPDAICLFEYDTGFPLRRHWNVPGFTAAAKNIVFTLRTTATVGNYDYLIEYDFFLDGGIEVHVRASGYISAAHYFGNDDYGFHIHDHLSGAMHDHVLTFKADIDIFGESNSLQKVEFVPDTIE